MLVSQCNTDLYSGDQSKHYAISQMNLLEKKHYFQGVIIIPTTGQIQTYNCWLRQTNKTNIVTNSNFSYKTIFNWLKKNLCYIVTQLYKSKNYFSSCTTGFIHRLLLVPFFSFSLGICFAFCFLNPFSIFPFCLEALFT